MFISVIIFIIGLLVGSFLNVVIYRLPKNKSFLGGRSYCPRCKKTIAWYDNIPLLSFIVLGGRCRHCKKKISWQYPAVELATGLLFFVVAHSLFIVHCSPLVVCLEGIGLRQVIELVFYLFAVCALILVFVFDLKYYVIPDEIVVPAIITSFVYFLFNHLFEEYWLIAVLLLPAAFFSALIIFSKGKWMGWGDVKFVIFMAFLLGWSKLLAALFISFVGGSIIGLALVAVGSKTMKSALPFGTFLAPATFLALVWGEVWILWYFSLLEFVV